MKLVKLMFSTLAEIVCTKFIGSVLCANTGTKRTIKNGLSSTFTEYVNNYNL